MSEFDMPAEVIDSATEEGQARIAELKAASAAEKTRKKRRSEAELICDGLMEAAKAEVRAELRKRLDDGK